MPPEKILIKFEKQGDTKLIQALNNLAKAQENVKKGFVDTKAKLTTLNPKMLQLSASLKAQGLSWKDLGISTGVATKALMGNKTAIALVDARMKSYNATAAVAISNTGALSVSHHRLGAQNKLLARSFATLRSQLLLVSFGAMLIERAFVSLVKTYGRQEAADRKLQAGLANVADTIPGVTQRLIDYSAALQKTTAFGDEMITTGMVQLTTFGLNEEAMKALTPQVLNVARAIQTVSGTMPDLNSLFIAFGKATTTGIGTLTRYGVVLTENERAQLKTMGASERAIKIGEILERQYGGLAEAYAKTTIGMLEAADAARGDAAEALGEVLAPAVLFLANGLKLMFEAMSPERITRFFKAVGVGAIAFGLLSGNIWKAVKAIRAFQIAQIKTGWGAIAAGIGLASFALMEYFGILGGEGRKTLTDAQKLKMKNIALGEEEDQRLKDLQKTQEESVASLEKQLKLLNAKTKVDKMLINLGHEASPLERKLIDQIVEKTQAIADEKEAVKAAEKARRAAIKASVEEYNNLTKAIEDAIKEQENLDAAMKKQFPTLGEYLGEMGKQELVYRHNQELLRQYIEILDKLGKAHNFETDAMKKSREALEARQKMEENQIKIEREWAAARSERVDEELEQEIQFQNALAESRRHAEELNKTFLKPPDPPDVGLMTVPLKEALDAQLGIISEQEEKVINLKRQAANEAILLNREGVLTQEEIYKNYADRIKAIDQMILEDKKITLKEGVEMTLASFSAMTSAISTQINARMKNEMDAMKKTTEYKRADSDKRKEMEKGVTGAYAKERTRIARFEKATAFAEASIAIAAKLADPKVFLNPILFALVTALGAVQLAAIASTPIPKFARGGMIGGRRHSQGGTTIEAEQGEFIMSRSAVQSVGLENLNRMNQGGGSSVTVNVSGNVLTQDFVETDLAEAIREAARRGTNFGIG